MCRKVKDMGIFWHQVSETSEKISLKVVVEFAASFNMGDNLK